MRQMCGRASVDLLSARVPHANRGLPTSHKVSKTQNSFGLRHWTTATPAAQTDVQRLTQDLGQPCLELPGAETVVAEMTQLAKERQVTVYGMAGDLEKLRERDAAVWLPRLKEFRLRLELEPEAELVRPAWLDADVWERGVLPLVSRTRVSEK